MKKSFTNEQIFLFKEMVKDGIIEQITEKENKENIAFVSMILKKIVAINNGFFLYRNIHEEQIRDIYKYNGCLGYMCGYFFEFLGINEKKHILKEWIYKIL